MLGGLQWHGQCGRGRLELGLGGRVRLELLRLLLLGLGRDVALGHAAQLGALAALAAFAVAERVPRAFLRAGGGPGVGVGRRRGTVVSAVHHAGEDAALFRGLRGFGLVDVHVFEAVFFFGLGVGDLERAVEGVGRAWGREEGAAVEGGALPSVQ